MKIPFTTESFLSIFQEYNNTVWPVQLIFNLIGLLIVASILIDRKHSHYIVFSALGFFWIWMGLVYHIIFFSQINPLAIPFGILFILQGLIFLFNGVYKQTIKLKFNLDFSGILGCVVIVYAVILYPVASYFLGHLYPRSPTFGVPCPTAIFTFGILLFAQTRIPWYLIIIPFLWCLIGFSAAVNLSMWEDVALVIAGAVSSGILLFIKPNSILEPDLIL